MQGDNPRHIAVTFRQMVPGSKEFYPATQQRVFAMRNATEFLPHLTDATCLIRGYKACRGCQPSETRLNAFECDIRYTDRHLSKRF